MIDGATPPPAENRRIWRGLLIVMVVALAALRFSYLVWFCPLDLAPDEAHYWDWSRNLDWSYYSKGPLVAWLIRASIELFGPLSVALTGGEMMAIRLPAVVCGSLLLVSLYVLSVQVFRSERLAFMTAFFTATLPAISAGSILMTIDSPFVCLWGWALVVAHRAVFGNSRWAWLAAGVLVGLGILAKYTMALWLLSLGLFCLFTPAFRPLLFRSGFWLMVGVAFLCSLPILWWNAHNNWVTFRHVAIQAGVPNSGIRWLGPLEYAGMQFALLLGYWFVAWLCGMIHFRPTRSREPGIRYLWWMSAPTFLVFALSSLKSSGQINWPVAAYLSGSVLMTAWLMKAVDSVSVSYRRLTVTGVGLACSLGIALTIFSYESRLVRPALLEVANRIKKDDPYAIRSIDPTTRLRGWKYLGREIDAVRRDVVDREGIDPLVAGTSWSTSGELGFYCQGHPTAFSLGPYFGDRKSQYDLWRPNPVEDKEVFRGKTFLVVGDHEPTLRHIFAQVNVAREVIYREGDLPVSAWTIWICRGYRGATLGPQTHY